MSVPVPPFCTAFAGHNIVGSGSTIAVAEAVKRAVDAGHVEPILIFDDATGQPVDFDLRGTVADVVARVEARLPTQETTIEQPMERTVGRPKLGVVAREVTLLPRHWEWLAAQPGGASVALRKLVEDARKLGETQDRVRLAREAAYRFMSAMAGNGQGFEEATRALFAGDRQGFQQFSETWPVDIRDHALWMAAPGLDGQDAAQPIVSGVFYRSRVSKPAVAGA